MLIPEKIKKEYREKLISLNEQTFDKSLFIDEDILDLIAYLTEKTGYEIALVIDRKGKIVDVVCGDKHSATFAIEEGVGRYSGYRVIHTHPNGVSKLSNMDMSFLRNKKLDCMCAISVRNGEAYDAQVAYLIGENFHIVNVHDSRYINKYGLVEKIYDCEKEYNLYLK